LLADTAIAVEKGGTGNALAGVDPAGNVLAGTVVSGNTGTGGADTDADGDALTVASVTNTAVSAVAVNTSSLAAVNVAGVYGTLTMTQAGAYTYTVDNSNAAVQALKSSSDKLYETFTYKVTDAYGGVSTSTLTVTIQGANDAPVAVADFNIAKESLAGTTGSGYDYTGVTAYSTTSGATYDPLGYKATGTVLTNDTDVDASDTKTVQAATLTGTHGLLVLNSNGTYTYTPTVNNASLSEGQSAYEVFTYTLLDAAGLTHTATLTITVLGSGSNDPDAVDDANSVVEAGGTISTVAATGNVLGGTGVSAGDKADTTPTGSTLAVSGARATSDTNFSSVTTNSTVSGKYGVLTISSNGAYSYALDNTIPDVQALNVGESLIDSFNYKTLNSLSKVDAATLTITINGTNDGPTLDLNNANSASVNYVDTFTEGGQAVALSTAAGIN
jgi:VCBS repeat-containing protein